MTGLDAPSEAARWRTCALPVLGGALLGACVALLLGQDSGHDIRNYHWYNPWALLHGRMDIDLGPAQLQGFFNPTLDLFYYLLVQGLGPRSAAAIMGAVQGGLVPLLWFVGARTLRADRGDSLAAVLRGAASVIGCLGVVSLTVLGTSRGDGLIAVGVLAGLVMLLRSADSAGRACARNLFLSGLLFGASVGLKPTALAFALGAGLALLTGSVPRVRRASWLLAGGLAGWGVTGAWWAANLQARFGNPFFPMANNVFRSEWVEPLHFGQTYAMAHSPIDLLLRPFQIASGHAVGWELPFGDDRLVLVLILAGLALARATAYRLRFGGSSRAASDAGAPAREDHGASNLLLRFAGFSYVVWLFGSGYFRFQLPLEALSPLLLLVLVERLGLPRLPSRLLAVGLLVMALVPLRPGPGDRIPFGDDLLGLELPALPDLEVGEERLVVLAGEDPLAFIANDFPGPCRFLSLFSNLVVYESDPALQGTNDRGLQRAIRRTLRDIEGPVYVVVGPTGINEEILAAYGLRTEPDSCRPIRTRIGERVELCDVRRGSVPPTPIRE